MATFFIRTKDQEAFVETENLQDAFDKFIQETPLDKLGAILIAHTEYFMMDNILGEAVAIRTTIPLVRLGIWSEEEAKDFNEAFMGTRIV